MKFSFKITITKRGSVSLTDKGFEAKSLMHNILKMVELKYSIYLCFILVKWLCRIAAILIMEIVLILQANMIPKSCKRRV
ncbi:MAG: hypothetical protein DRG59_04060 [Deltaproteobacteria bacterium]|nr:MAG: hypothetical protein DRG59_04060 [Deltaproteobacteria bacterium]